MERILEETALTPAAHLTCVGAARDEIDAIAREYWQLGRAQHRRTARRPARAGGQISAASGRLSRRGRSRRRAEAVAPFDISVAAYPEIHPDSSSRAFDLENLKRKVDAGADRAITQFFFSRGLFLPLPRRSGRSGDRRRNRAGHPAGLERRDDAPLRPVLRREHPAMARPAVRGSRRSARPRGS